MVHILGGDVIEPVFVKSALETFTILIDTREHETPALTQRIQQMGCPVLTTKLSFGDYSAQCVLPSGITYTLADKVSIERKQSLTEICGNFGTNRARFTREFERAKSSNAKTYILVEQATWEKSLQRPVSQQNGSACTDFQPNHLDGTVQYAHHFL